MSKEIIKITTVGNLISELEKLPRDKDIYCQFVHNGVVYSVAGTFIPKVVGGTITAIHMQHDDKDDLP